MKIEKQLQEQVELQNQEPNAVADHELRFITGGSDNKGKIGATTRGAPLGAGTTSISGAEYEAIRRAFSKK